MNKDGAHGIRNNQFHFRLAKTWNTLPMKAVEAENVNIFKARLGAIWSNSQTKFTIANQSNEDNHEQFEETIVCELKYINYY